VTEEARSFDLTIIYDNNAYDRRLTTAWGFAAWLEFQDSILLFDTGGDGRILLQNMQVLGLDPLRLQSIILSHAHGDHTGGLDAILEAGARPVVYMLPSFSGAYKRQVGQKAEVIDVEPWQSIAEGIYTTGELGRSTPEQSLVIRTSQGLVVMTGCAHPGIVEIVEQIREHFKESVYLVLGGFHLKGKSKKVIKAILADFQRLGVERIAPCHCTGEKALRMFAAGYGEDFIQAGVGKVIRMEAGYP
jgi:7,8-dihydropterin-6-yl-methyl-4-(beta-D-ribofuranosyl)aminobenzene 5'-phosphate synthase